MASLDYIDQLLTFLLFYSPVQEMHVVDNLGDHMIGHVYVKFADEEDAADAENIMNGRYYDGVAMAVEFSPVTEFREARCRDYDEGSCSRAGFCNFIHAKPVPGPLIRSLQEDVEADRRREQDDRRRAAKDERRHSKKRSSSRRDKSSSSHHRSSRHRGDDDEDKEGGGHDDGDSDSDDPNFSPIEGRKPKKTRRSQSNDNKD
jgi:splicing factor U2AF subunit